MFERFRYKKYSFPIWEVVEYKENTLPPFAANLQVLKFFVYDKKTKEKKEVTCDEYHTTYKHCKDVSF
ncbi:MAG: hypothetical protein LBM13_03840 [Candidatus Ancillula sp.]|jgi:hypothetical protein|nr:hypothetical protein [Candidatus Ancillula sp.]